MSSELLFADDNLIILGYSPFIDKTSYNKFKFITLLSIPLSGLTIFLSKSFSLKMFILSFCAINIFREIYLFTQNSMNVTVISNLINSLQTFNSQSKKCLITILQYTTSLNYYTHNPDDVSIGKMLKNFTEMYYSSLHLITRKLRQKSSNFLLNVPLTIELNDMELLDPAENINLKDIKVII